ncbi:MAG TPA: site-specific integrase [Hymenobacter sp.]
MAKISFLLTEPNATKLTPVFAFLSFDGKRVKVYTGLSVDPRQWIKADQRLLTRGYPKNGLTNDAFQDLEDRLLTYYAECRAQGILPTADDLRAVAVPKGKEPELSQAEVVTARPTFWSFFDEFLAQSKEQGQPRTAQASATSGRHLREFGEQAKITIDFDAITPALGDKFASYLLKIGQTDNTIAKQFVRLKRFMKWAADRGYHTNAKYQRLTWQRHDPEILTLTNEEVAAIEGLPLVMGSYLDNARALFLLACYTGLRYSDLVSIRSEHLKGQLLRITMQKTRETVVVPLTTTALELVQRQLAGEVRLITNQKLNEYLKELGRMADITEPFELIRYRGGKRETTTMLKWEKIGCHTGRRTFVTLSLERGLRPEIIMKITGHKDWKSFQRYVNITDSAVEREFRRVHA